ncbi:MAG: hypothetical protein V9G04_05455 [Nocardioides sp.]|jgi:hypothetical protein
MNPREDEPDLDRAWRDIVDNFGERAWLEETPDQPTPEQPTPHDAAPRDEAGSGRNLFEPVPGLDIFAPKWDDDEDFVPPPPPAMVRPEPPRLVAWAGVTVVPLLMLALALIGTTPPPMLAYACLVWAVGGFAYLVFTMPRGPREPWDNGAKV